MDLKLTNSNIHLRSLVYCCYFMTEKEEALQMAKKKVDEALASKEDAMALPQKCNEFKRLVLSSKICNFGTFQIVLFVLAKKSCLCTWFM